MASRTTNYAEIQQDEMEALRSIYMKDFEEEAVKTGAWNVGDSAFLKYTIYSVSVVLDHGELYEFFCSCTSLGVFVLRQV